MTPSFPTLSTSWFGLGLALILGLVVGRYVWAVAFAYTRLLLVDAQARAQVDANIPLESIPDARLLWRALIVGLHIVYPRPAGDATPAWTVWFPAGFLALLYVLAAAYTPDIASAMALAWASSLLLLLSLIDAYTRFLPDALTLPLLWVGLALSLLGVTPVPPSEALAAVMLAYASLWLIAWAFRFLRGKDGMGGGDIKLLAAIGAWVGWPDVFLVLLGASLGGIGTALILRLWQPEHAKALDNPYAFGPYLASAAMALLWLRALGVT